MSKVGPIIKDTTFVPKFQIQSFPVYYVTNGNKCENSRSPVGKMIASASSGIKYLYDYDTVLPNTLGQMDVTCTSNNKTFIGWSVNSGDNSVSNVNIRKDVYVYPVFADQLPVTVFIGNRRVYQTFVDAGTTVKDETIRHSAMNKINSDKLSEEYNITSMYNSLVLYTTSTCDTVYRDSKVTSGLNLYIKPDPWITFTIGTDGASFSDKQTTPKKIALSSLSDGSVKTPSAIINDKHKEFSKWTLVTSTTVPYPQALNEDSTQLKNYNPTSYYLPVTYTAEFVTKTYRVTFYDEKKECSSAPTTVISTLANTIIDVNNSDFAKLNCSRAGSDFAGWQEKFTTQSYCPAINILFCIIMIVIIAVVVKYFCNKTGKTGSNPANGVINRYTFTK